MFIGSSSEGLTVAEIVKANIEKQCCDWLEIKIWNGGDIFALNSNTLDSLIKTAMQYDYAILVATNDDLLKSRHKQKAVARDNVIFEAGLFVGALGKHRTFIIADKKIDLPSDFNGTTVSCYCQNNDLIIACDNIVKELNKTQHSYQLKHLPSATLAMGYFDNFIIQFCKKRKASKLKIIIPNSFEDINRETEIYISNHPSKKSKRFFFDSNRPIGYRYINEKSQYWDIPTTLQTIRKLINMIIPQTEIGNNPEIEEWLKKETHDFGQTLAELIKKENICSDLIEIEFI